MFNINLKAIHLQFTERNKNKYSVLSKKKLRVKSPLNLDKSPYSLHMQTKRFFLFVHFARSDNNQKHSIEIFVSHFEFHMIN